MAAQTAFLVAFLTFVRNLAEALAQTPVYDTLYPVRHNGQGLGVIPIPPAREVPAAVSALATAGA